MPRNYRPISLLATLSKILEAVVACRISSFTEKYQLLPNNHFGARKQKSTTHALSYLQERIMDAWRGRKTLALVSFDVKRAYNNVATGPLSERLRSRRIPRNLVRWIADFCTERKANVVFQRLHVGSPEPTPIWITAGVTPSSHSIPVLQSGPSPGSYQEWRIDGIRRRLHCLDYRIVCRTQHWTNTNGIPPETLDVGKGKWCSL